MMPTMAVSNCAEVGGAADLIQHAGMLELGAQGDRVGDLVASIRRAIAWKMRPLIGSAKWSGREELADPVIGVVVGQQGAEQRLLGCDVAGGQALGQAQQRRVR